MWSAISQETIFRSKGSKLTNLTFTETFSFDGNKNQTAIVFSELNKKKKKKLKKKFKKMLLVFCLSESYLILIKFWSCDLFFPLFLKRNDDQCHENVEEEKREDNNKREIVQTHNHVVIWDRTITNFSGINWFLHYTKNEKIFCWAKKVHFQSSQWPLLRFTSFFLPKTQLLKMCD